MARREEWQEQKKLARLLDKWLDPACTFWTATDPVAPSALSGAIRKQRGVKPGVPDQLILYRGKLIAIELKSRCGKCSPPQRAVREDLLRAGARGWWVCRTARAAMWALRKSGVKFRTRANDDGSLDRWQSPRLPAWEVPKRNPQERRPRAPEWRPEVAAADPIQQLPQSPDVAARRRAARRRWRVHQPQARETSNDARGRDVAFRQAQRKA